MWPLIFSLALATEPDSYARDLFDSPSSDQETPEVQVNLEYRPRVESSPRGPIRFAPGAENTEFSHRARLMTTVKHEHMLAKFSFQNVYVAGSPEAEAPVEALEAYVELGNETLRTRVGRQQITLGTGRVLTGPYWSQRGRPFDAIRVVYRGDRTRADALVGRHNGSGVFRDLAGAYLERDLGALRTAVTAVLETNRTIRSSSRDGLEAGYTRFTGGVDFSLASPLILTGEALVQTGRFEGDGASIGGNDGGGEILAGFAGAGLGYRFNEWFAPVAFAEWLSGDGDLEDDRVGVFDTVLGYRRRLYGRIDRFIRIPDDTRRGGLVDAGVRTESPAFGGHIFTEWHYFQIPTTDLDGNSGPAGAELDLRYVYPLYDVLVLEVAYFTFARLGDYRRDRNVKLKHYGYVMLDLQI